MAVTQRGGHIIVERSGRKIWGTDVPPVNLFLANQITPTVAIAFPEFPKDWVYGFSRHDVDGGGFPSVLYRIGYAMLVSKILPSEWNDSQVIGAVPAGCNYIDVRVVLSWTKLPSPSFGSPVSTPLAAGVPVHLQGGSGVLELANGIRRAIHVGLSGTSVVLTQFQSSRTGAPLSYSPWGRPTDLGWSYLSSPNGSLQNKIGQMTIGSTSASWVPPYRGGPNDPGVNLGWDDHSSNWSIQFIITPGRVNASV